MKGIGNQRIIPRKKDQEFVEESLLYRIFTKNIEECVTQSNLKRISQFFGRCSRQCRHNTSNCRTNI